MLRGLDFRLTYLGFIWGVAESEPLRISLRVSCWDQE